MSTATTMETTNLAHIGRQPILDRDVKVIGYELLYRDSETATQCIADSDAASASVMANAVLEFGLDTLSQGGLAFFNCAASTWSEDFFELLPKERVVLEVLEDALSDQIVDNVRRAKERGYRIALDDVVSLEDREKLLPYVDIVKLDLPKLSEDEVRAFALEHKENNRLVVAEKVETQAQFEATKAAGCDYFQGYFFEKPTTLTQKRVPQVHLQTMQLLTELSDDRADFDTIASKVANDVTLSVRILKYANSAGVGCKTRISSIERAIAMVGFDAVRKWVRVISMSMLSSNKPSELVFAALMRARFCEFVAAGSEQSHPAAFTVGLFSLLDAILDRPLDALLVELHLDQEIEAALLNEEGELGQAIRIVRAYERSDWDLVDELVPNASTNSQLSKWFVASVSQAQQFYELCRE